MGKPIRYILILSILVISFIITQDNDLEISDENLKLPDDFENIPRRYPEDDEEFDNPYLLQNKQKGPAGMNPAQMQGMQGMQGMPGMQGAQMPQATPQPVQDTQDRQLTFSLYEFIMMGFLILFLINCLIGKQRNQSLCQRWYDTNRHFFEENYAHIGVNTEYNTKTSVAILKESYNNFKFYASGRVFTNWMLVHLNLKKRQDLLSSLTSIFLFNDKDRLIYEASISPNMDELPLVLCICKRKDVKHMKKSYSDINFFTKSYDPKFVNSNIAFLSEEYEDYEDVFENREFQSLYSKIEKYIDLIYFTDRQTYSKEKYSIYFSFDVNGDSQTFENLTQFVHVTIDLLCQKSKLSQRVVFFYLVQKRSRED
jgi:hypothetical protein